MLFAQLCQILGPRGVYRVTGFGIHFPGDGLAWVYAANVFHLFLQTESQIDLHFYRGPDDQLSLAHRAEFVPGTVVGEVHQHAPDQLYRGMNLYLIGTDRIFSNQPLPLRLQRHALQVFPGAGEIIHIKGFSGSGKCSSTG